MASEQNFDKHAIDIDKALGEWRQGDCVLGEHWVVHRFAPSLPLHPSSIQIANEGVDLAEDEVKGLVIVTQTCDLVRACRQRPFVEICPLVAVEDSLLNEIQRGVRPAFAYIPLLADQKLVADLDRTMTVEKGVVAGWFRTPGCQSDEEIRSFADALSRKRSRFAFPDDFTEFVGKLQDRIKDKHDKNSPEGRALKALREIRVQPEPSWQSDKITLIFWFIRHDDETSFEGRAWTDFLDEWLKRVPASGRYTAVFGQVASLNDMTAANYVASDRLDLDHLSKSE